MPLLLKEHTLLPGFAPGLGLTLFWLTLVVLLPLSTLVVGAGAVGARAWPYREVRDGRPTGEIRLLAPEEASEWVVAAPEADLSSGHPIVAWQDGVASEVAPEEVELLAPTRGEKVRTWFRRILPELWGTLSSRRTLASFRVTFGTAFAAALLNLFLGGVVALALTRVRLPLRGVVDALVDLPFAMPTAVCGIAMAALYAPTGPVGALAGRVGLRLAFNPIGITLAMVFIGMPFVVRALQPALAELGHELEEAAGSLGASRWQTWRRVLIPTLSPALLTGFTLAFARGLGEYGTIIFIAGNTPLRTEVTSLLIVTRLEQFDYPGAAVLALSMLLASLLLILALNRLFGRRRAPGKGR